MTSRLNTQTRWIKHIGFLLILLFLIGTLELAATVFTANDWVLTTTSELSSTRWYLLWLNRVHRGESPQVTNYQIDEHHPYLGWSPKRNSRTALPNGSVVSFTSTGIRGSREYRFEKPNDIQRIAIIGDSFTFGEEVSDAETYSAQLEKKLSNTEVLNFGVHGYGLDQMLLRFEQKALAYQPNVVIFAFVYDDIGRGLVRFRDYQKPLFKLKSNHEMVLTNTPIPEPAELLNTALWQPKSLLALKLIYERWQFHDFDHAKHEPFARAVFSQVYRKALAHNVVPVFLFLPAGTEMIDDQSALLAGERILFDFCENTTAICLSARPYLLAAYTQGARYDTQRHYSASTHTVIADGLLNDLISRTVIPHAQ